MLYEAKTPSEYLKVVADDWRNEKLIEGRKLIKKNAPELKEGIQYKMLSYEYGDKVMFNLNAQRAFVSLYVGNADKVENARELLKEFNVGKGCVRIKKSIDLSKSNLEEFIIKSVEVWKNGENTDC